jgi:hypothetical protein
MPAEAGIQSVVHILGPRFRGDERWRNGLLRHGFIVYDALWPAKAA